jgi:hypothetical protein
MTLPRKGEREGDRRAGLGLSEAEYRLEQLRNEAISWSKQALANVDLVNHHLRPYLPIVAQLLTDMLPPITIH